MGVLNPVGFTAGSPILGTSTAILAATASVIPSTVGAGLAQPDVPRNVSATPGGTTANVLAVSVTIVGTDIAGNVITEILPAFSVGSGSIVTGLKAFRTVTSVTIPAVGSATTVSIGTGTVIGLPVLMFSNQVIATYLNSVKEGTQPTVGFSATILSLNTASLNSALNGTQVDIAILQQIR